MKSADELRRNPFRMHINRDLLLAFYRGDIRAEELLRLAQEHLLSVCRQCRDEFSAFCEELSDEHGPQAQRTSESPSQDAVHRAQQWERMLDRLPRDVQLDKVHRARSRFRGPAFTCLMLQRARAATPADPGSALHSARLAEVAIFLDEQHVHLHALAIAYQANALRVLGRDEEAAQLFLALRLCASSVTDTRTLAEIASFEGSMAMDHRHFTEAAQRFSRAVSLFHLLGDVEGEARNLLKLGYNAYFSGRLHAAVLATQEALDLIVDDESSLYLAARHNLGLFLVADGEGDVVAQMLCEDLPLYRKWANEAAHWHTAFSWLSGKVAFVRGNLEQAEALFLQTRGRFDQEGNEYDEALVGLDLLRVYLVQGRFEDVGDLAESLLVVFARYRLTAEAQEPLAVFEVASRQRRVGMQLVLRLASHLEQGCRAKQDEPYQPEVFC